MPGPSTPTEPFHRLRHRITGSLCRLANSSASCVCAGARVGVRACDRVRVRVSLNVLWPGYSPSFQPAGKLAAIWPIRIDGSTFSALAMASSSRMSSRRSLASYLLTKDRGFPNRAANSRCETDCRVRAFTTTEIAASYAVDETQARRIRDFQMGKTVATDVLICTHFGDQRDQANND